MKMLLDASTTEKLRSKHVRTLELLQKTIDENVALRDIAAQLQANGGKPLQSNRDGELEDELRRLKAEHSLALQELQTSRLLQQQAEQALANEQRSHQRMASDLQTLETTVQRLRESSQRERSERGHELEQAVAAKVAVEQELAQLQRAFKELKQQSEENQSNRDQQALTREIHTQQEIQRLRSALESQTHELEKRDGIAQSLSLQIATVKDTNEQISRELVESRARNLDLQGKLKQAMQVLPSPSKSMERSNSLQEVSANKMAQLEQANAKLKREHAAMLDQIATLQAQLMELSRAHQQSHLFGVHVDLKRENAQLRAQIDELKQVQRRFLTTAKKKTMHFPAL